MCVGWKNLTTSDSGSLGSCIVEERSDIITLLHKYVNALIANSLCTSTSAAAGSLSYFII